MPVFTCRPRNHALQHRLQLSVHCESHSAFTGLERWILLFFFFFAFGFYGDIPDIWHCICFKYTTPAFFYFSSFLFSLCWFPHLPIKSPLVPVCHPGLPLQGGSLARQQGNATWPTIRPAARWNCSPGHFCRQTHAEYSWPPTLSTLGAAAAAGSVLGCLTLVRPFHFSYQVSQAHLLCPCLMDLKQKHPTSWPLEGYCWPWQEAPEISRFI